MSQQTFHDPDYQPVHEAPARPRFDPTPYVDARLQAVDRLRKMSLNLAFNAWEQRFSDPLCPHSLAYLYLQNDPRRPGMWQLTASWQLWLDRPEVRVLPQLLFDLHHQFAPRAAGMGFDIRDELSIGRDEPMAGGLDAFYIGLGVVSLDTGERAWEDVQQHAATAMDVPAVIWIVLTDGTVMVCQRHGRNRFNAFSVEASDTLAHGPARPLFDWSLTPVDDLCGRAHDRDILRWAAELSDTFSQADNGRLDALKQAAHLDQTTSARRRGHQA